MLPNLIALRAPPGYAHQSSIGGRLDRLDSDSIFHEFQHKLSELKLMKDQLSSFPLQRGRTRGDARSGVLLLLDEAETVYNKAVELWRVMYKLGSLKSTDVENWPWADAPAVFRVRAVRQSAPAWQFVSKETQRLYSDSAAVYNAAWAEYARAERERDRKTPVMLAEATKAMTWQQVVDEYKEVKNALFLLIHRMPTE
jgi:hypothetical protein